VAEVSGYIGNFTVQVKNRFNPDDKNTELSVGAIIVATGYDHFDPRLKPELGYGTCGNILTAPELEALVRTHRPEMKNRSSWKRTEEHSLHPVRGIARPHGEGRVLLAGLLHVHGQAGRLSARGLSGRKK
jgi:hypothetical protein